MTFMEKAFTGLMIAIFILGLICFFSTKNVTELENTVGIMIFVFFGYSIGRVLNKLIVI